MSTGAVDRRLGAGWLQLRLAGELVPADRVGPVTIRHGRADVDAGASPGTCTVLLDRAALSALPSVGAELRVELSDEALAQLTDDPRVAAAARVRFAGDVTDAALQLRTAAGQTLLQLVAVGPLARLGRVKVGDTPWPDELDGARAGRILARAAEVAGVVVDDVDPGVALVQARDVDAQPPGKLLDDLQVATGGQLHAGRAGALSWHDRDRRRGARTAVVLDAGDVLRDTGWRLDLAGAVNDVTVTYGQAPAGGVVPEARVVDGVSVELFGRLSARLGAVLVDQLDATERARQLVGRRSRPRWRIDALTVELLRTLTSEQAAGLLAAEPGALLRVEAFPAAGPATTARLFVESWTEAVTRDAYLMTLSVVDYSLAGPSPRWVDVDPATTWADVPADLTWLGGLGWSTNADRGRWLDRPAAERWADADPDLTWATA